MARIARIALGAASPLLLLACLVGGRSGAWLFALLSPLVPPALILIGGCRPSADRRIAWVALVLALSLEAGAVGVMLLGDRPEAGPSVLGFPAATLLMLASFGLVPLLVVPWAYAALSRSRGDRRPPRRSGGAPRGVRR